jgi:hypothetical protein
MPNQLVPTLALDLGGKTRHLRLDMNALCRYEREMLVNTLKPETWQKFQDGGFTALELRALLWACVVPEDGSAPTVDDVGAWLTPDNIAEVAAALAGLREQSAPEPAPEGEEAGAAGADPLAATQEPTG